MSDTRPVTVTVEFTDGTSEDVELNKSSGGINRSNNALKREARTLVTADTTNDKTRDDIADVRVN